jgi:hypothetical protein
MTMTFEKAFQDLPLCLIGSVDDPKTLDDLRWAALIQLDLIEEGQDGTFAKDAPPIRRWLARYGRPKADKPPIEVLCSEVDR